MASPLPFAIWRAARDRLESELSEAAAAWRAIPGNGSRPMGLTPDSVKNSPQWRAAYSRYWQAHKALARHNSGARRIYGKELAQEAQERRAAAALRHA